MIFYDVTGWSLPSILRWRGSVIPAAILWATSSTSLQLAIRHSGICDTFLAEAIDFSRDSTALAFLWGGFTAVLGILLSLRTNQSYQRFWEGARLVYLVRGEWFNCVSSLLSFCTERPELAVQVRHFQHILVRLVSLVHCMALQHVCELAEDSLEILDMEGFDEASLDYLETVHDRCEVLVQWLQRLVMKADREKILDAPAPILTRSFQELSRGVVNLNNVRRIKDIPFPYPYHQVIIVLMLLHWLFTPLLACLYVNSPVLSAALVFVVQAGMWSAIYIAGQMDQPFGEDANDLPMAEMQQDFNRSLLSLLHPMAQKVPAFNASFANLAGTEVQSNVTTRSASKKRISVTNVNTKRSDTSSDQVEVRQTDSDQRSEQSDTHPAESRLGTTLSQMEHMLELDEDELKPIPESKRTAPLSPKTSAALAPIDAKSPRDERQTEAMPREVSVNSMVSFESTSASVGLARNPLMHKPRRLSKGHRDVSGADLIGVSFADNPLTSKARTLKSSEEQR